MFTIQRITPATDTARSLDFDEVKYRGPIGDGQVAVEVSYREDVLLEPLLLPLGSPYFVAFSVPTMAPDEMMAEKLRTLAQRQRPTDLLDSGMLLRGLAGEIDDAIVAELVPTKFAAGLVRPGDHAGRIESNIRAMEAIYEAAVRAVAPDPAPYDEMASVVLGRLNRFFK
jgi:hypothetical protein